MSLAEELRTHIVQVHLRGEDPDSVSVDDDLIDNGVLDSMAIIKLAAHLEQAYGIVVGSDDIQPDNFCSATQLAAFVSSRRQA